MLGISHNRAVGTIMGIWPKSTGLLGAKGSDQVTSLVAIYGPRTTVLVALDDGTYEFSYGCTPEGCQVRGESGDDALAEIDALICRLTTLLFALWPDAASGWNI